MNIVTPKNSVASMVSVDVVMLAVVIGLHVTKREQSLKLLLIILIVVHVMATTRRFTPVTSADPIGDQAATAGQAATEQTAVGAAREVSKTVSNASNSAYNRQFTSPPQMSATGEILPTTSAEANTKLVASRTRFFEDIIDS